MTLYLSNDNWKSQDLSFIVRCNYAQEKEDCRFLLSWPIPGLIRSLARSRRR